jgi:hypothetical protein
MQLASIDRRWGTHAQSPHVAEHFHDFQGAGGAGSGVRGSRCRWDAVRVLYRRGLYTNRWRGGIAEVLRGTARRLIDAID